MKILKILVVAVCVFFTASSLFAQALTKDWTRLLNNDFKNWDIWVGDPSAKLIEQGYPKGQALGLGNDPLHIFVLEGTAKEPVLHISGEQYGGLSTKEEYENYHFKVEFKWGENKFAPKLNAKRDNGIVYHATGPMGVFSHAWMASQEMQVQEGDMGDLYALAGPVMDVRSSPDPAQTRNGWIYDPAGSYHSFSEVKESSNHCARIKDYENPHGEWNTLELICIGDKSIHIVNGHVVMVLENSRFRKPDGSETRLAKGKIQLQSEGAECYYRNISIRKMDKVPDEFLTQIKQVVEFK